MGMSVLGAVACQMFLDEQSQFALVFNSGSKDEKTKPSFAMTRRLRGPKRPV